MFAVCLLVLRDKYFEYKYNWQKNQKKCRNKIKHFTLKLRSYNLIILGVFFLFLFMLLVKHKQLFKENAIICG